MAELLLKVCCLGPCNSGKTLLCRALAEQPFAAGDYQPTSAVRIQELGRQIGQDLVTVQLWDVAGGQKYQDYWEVLSKEADGVLLIIDPSHLEQERELEQLYLNFAQPNSLAMRQCMVLALSVGANEGSAAGWSGLRGKLRKLPSAHVSLDYTAPETGRKAAGDALTKLLAGCLAQKKDKIERAVIGG